MPKNSDEAPDWDSGDNYFDLARALDELLDSDHYPPDEEESDDE